MVKHFDIIEGKLIEADENQSNEEKQVAVVSPK
jgi:hypothetical protein